MIDTETPTPRCGRCKDPFWPEQEGQVYCSTRCREAAKKRRQRFRLRHGKDAGELLGPLGTGVVNGDASLADLYERARAPREFVSLDADFVVEPDEADEADDDRTILDSIPGQGMADEIRKLRADVQSRMQKALQRYDYTIRMNFQGNVTLAAQRDPRIRAIVSEFQKELESIDAAEKSYMRADAVEQANRPWNVAARQDRAQGMKNMRDFAADLRPARLLEPTQAGRENHEAFMFGSPSSVFGSDSELFAKSSVAQTLNVRYGGNALSPDGWI